MPAATAAPTASSASAPAKQRHFGAQDTSFLAAAANILAGAIQRRQLEQRHELMIRDMRHRSGNLFSQLLALFSQTAKTSKSIADLASKYQSRVLAMANAHRLITEGGWKSIPIMELLYVVLGPYLDRVSFSGPNIELEPDPIFNLSAALHELAANAIKHGSLSRPKGQLDLSWSVSRTERGMTLDSRLGREERAAGAAAAASRLWLAADRHGHRAAVERRSACARSRATACRCT